MLEIVNLIKQSNKILKIDEIIPEKKEARTDSDATSGNTQERKFRVRL